MWQITKSHLTTTCEFAQTNLRDDSLVFLSQCTMYTLSIKTLRTSRLKLRFQRDPKRTWNNMWSSELGSQTFEKHHHHARNMNQSGFQISVNQKGGSRTSVKNLQQTGSALLSHRRTTLWLWKSFSQTQGLATPPHAFYKACTCWMLETPLHWCMCGCIFCHTQTWLQHRSIEVPWDAPSSTFCASNTCHHLIAHCQTLQASEEGLDRVPLHHYHLKQRALSLDADKSSSELSSGTSTMPAKEWFSCLTSSPSKRSV